MAAPMHTAITVMHQNIDTVASRRMAVLEKVIPGASLSKRMETVIEGIKSKRPNIVCLQELRKCDNMFGEHIDTVTPIVDGLKGLGYEVRLVSYRGDDEKAFKYCIAIRGESVKFDGEPERVYMSMTPWTMTPDDKPLSYKLANNFGVRFERCFVNQMVKVGNKRLCVTTAHLPLLEKPREHALRVLMTSIAHTRDNLGVPVIAMGDFNTIPDMGGGKNIEFIDGFCSGAGLTRLPLSSQPVGLYEFCEYCVEELKPFEAVRTFVAMPTDFLFPGTKTVTESEEWKAMDADIVVHAAESKDLGDTKVAEYRKYIAEQWLRASTPDKLTSILDHMLVTKGIYVVGGRAVCPEFASYETEQIRKEMKKAILDGRLPDGYVSDHVPIVVHINV